MQKCHDMVGIGFGPANIALAIAIEEARQDGTMPPFDARFLEAQVDPEWQGGMLLAGSDIQNHPARDLVTLRNPRSHYTFLNYLHLSGRLIEHLNLPGEFPLRSDYAAYVRWARGHFDDIVDYGQKVAAVSVTDHVGERVYAVSTAAGARYLARTLVVAPGRAPYVPAPFDSVPDRRVFHFSDYLYRIEALPEPPDTVVVIGGSQSAVEIMLDLSRRFPRSRIVNYVRSFGLRLKDTSPFSEEGFFPDFTRYYFEASRQSKAILDAYMRPTNYSSADGDVLSELYLHVYEQRLKGQQRVFVSGNRVVRSVDVRPGAVSLAVAEVHTGVVEQVDADVVVLATGFRDIGPGVHQERLPRFLDGIAEQVVFEDGYPRIAADYLVETPTAPPLLLNGLCETTHGIGDSGSFSLLSLRTAAIQHRLAAIASTVSASGARSTGGRGMTNQQAPEHALTWREPPVGTVVPGPVSRDFLDRQEVRESNARSYPRRLPIAVQRAAGALIEDVDGNVYLDFLSGAGVLSLGHNHPDVVAAVTRQLSIFTHGLDLPTPVKDKFTKLQLEMLPEPMRDRMKIHFCGPTGANAIEAAIKLCKIATDRGDIIAFQGGFHGSTTGAMSVTANREPRSQIRNSMPGVHFFPFSYCGRCPLGLRPDTCSTNCATYLERTLADPYGGVGTPAAVILELVQGEGGGIAATQEFVRRVRDVTRRADIPLVVDEVQTGCGRTGTWFAFEQYGIEPDVIVASKALSGVGLPVSILLYDQALDRWAPGAHIGTFRGNQLAFAAGVAALNVMRRDDVLGNVRVRGAELTEGLRRLAARTRWVAEVHATGLLLGIELVDPETGADATEFARAVQAAALRKGLILEVGGRHDCTLRLLPPLTVTEEQVDKALELLRLAFSEVESEFTPAALAHS